MMHKQPHNDTTNPPGQIINRLVNLEVPITKALEAFKDEQIEQLRGRVQQLEKELQYLRKNHLQLFLRHKEMLASYSRIQREFSEGVDKDRNL